MSLLVRPQHEQSHPKGLSVFAPFPLQFPLNYILKFKDFQGECEPLLSQSSFQLHASLFFKTKIPVMFFSDFVKSELQNFIE